MTDIAVVYDDSALMAYAHGQIGAAELISEINAEGRHVGVPSTCLAAALAELRDDWDITQLMRLVSTKTIVIVPLGADNAGHEPAEALRQVSQFARLAGCDLTVGHAVATALSHQAYYVTANPKRAAVALPPSWPVLDLRPVRLVSDRLGLAPVPTTAAPPPPPADIEQDHPPEDGSTAGMPVIQPMLATLGELPTAGDWGYEFKWDGVRAIAYVTGDELRLVGRNNEDLTQTYPELATLSTLLAGHRAVLDGEIVAHGKNGLPSFPNLQQRMRVRKPSPQLVRALPVRYYAFDLLHLDGTDLTPLSYVERRDALQRLDVNGESVDTPPHWTGDIGPALVSTARDMKLEGVMAKQLSSAYKSGQRSPAWVKVPLTHTTEVIVAGYKPGAGRRAGMIGSLLLGMYDAEDKLTYVGNVSAGLTDLTLRDLQQRLAELRAPTSPFDQPVPREHARHAQWVRPTLVADVTYRSWTPEHRLRQPSWKGLRGDRDPADIHLPSPTSPRLARS